MSEGGLLERLAKLRIKPSIDVPGMHEVGSLRPSPPLLVRNT